MKRALLFTLLLLLAIIASAWLGMTDARNANTASGQASLNTAQKKRIASHHPPGWDEFQGPNGLQQEAYRNTRRLVPFATPLSAPSAGEWRGRIREPEQDFDSFFREARKARGILLLQPIGQLPQDQIRVLPHLLDAMAHFFGMTAVFSDTIPLSMLPEECFRTQNGYRQINAESLMDLVLRPKVRGEVASVLAITNLDIYPGERWPFESAYGWSSFHNGTAVLSSSNILEPAPADSERNLLRICKLAVHELSHTFTLKHCSTYECLMNGCSTIAENDAKPFLLCPDCLAKLSVATGRNPDWHMRSMHDFCIQKSFRRDVLIYDAALKIFNKY